MAIALIIAMDMVHPGHNGEQKYGYFKIANLSKAVFFNYSA
jgi:hypothetical protein